LTETDNPGGPKEFIGKLGMPVLLKDVVRGLAEARNTTTEAIVETVQANLAELTRDDPWLTDTQRKISGEWQNGR
jgi:Tat protein secretion system quality control protein TatD with DNase activity